MKWLVLYLLSFAAVGVFAQGAAASGGTAEFQCSRNAVRVRAQAVAVDYETRDVTKMFQSIENYLARCKKTGFEFGVDMDHLRGLVKTSQKLAFARLPEELERGSKLGRVDDLLAQYRELAKSQGVSEEDVNTYLAKIEKTASQSANQEVKSCKPMNISAELGPVRDQDSIGWCYAFAAADLLSYKTKQRISAADIALGYNKNLSSDFSRTLGVQESSFTGGEMSGALRNAMRTGLCLEKDLPSEDNSGSELKSNLDQIDRLRRGKGRRDALACDDVRRAASSLFPNLSFDEIRGIALTTVNKDIVEKMRAGTCGKRLQYKTEVQSVWNSDASVLASALDENLDQNNPVVVSYRSKILYDKDAPMEYVQGGVVVSHGSVIAGRRFNAKTGECEYLLRNSWGRGCDSYDKRYECNEGQIWIPKKTLLRSTGGIDSLK